MSGPPNGPLQFPYTGILHTPGVLNEKPEARWSPWERKVYEDPKDPLYGVKPTWEFVEKTYLEPEPTWWLSPTVKLEWAAFKPVLALAEHLEVGSSEQERRELAYGFARDAVKALGPNWISRIEFGNVGRIAPTVLAAALEAAQAAWE